MDLAPQDLLQDLPHLSSHEDVSNDTEIEHPDALSACALCRRTLSSEHELHEDLHPFSVCGDCRFLLLEDFGTPIRESDSRGRSRRGRRTRYGSSESVEDLFSHQFSQIINLARQSHSVTPEREDLPVDFDASLRLMQQTSSITPSSSRRWHRLMSDSESDNFDYSDSYFGDNESNLSFSGHRLFYGDIDAISFSAYGGDSDISSAYGGDSYLSNAYGGDSHLSNAYGGDSDMSVDGNSFLDNDIFDLTPDTSDVDSDTDIDPMHAGDFHWNSDDHEELEENNQGEETNAGGVNMVEHREDAADRLGSGRDENDPWFQRADSSEFEFINWRHQETRDIQILPNIFADLDEPTPYFGSIYGDYIDARGLEQLLDHLANTDRSRRGAPPAALSAVNNLPRVLIVEEHAKPDDGLACAICKDSLTVGTEANQLPCHHLYHPSCILPWLSTRNSCPLCRYELPTDDMDYEDGKHNNGNHRLNVHEIQQQEVAGYSSSTSSEVMDATELDGAEEIGEEQGDRAPSTNLQQHRNSDRRRWFLIAAAPIISLMGVAFMLWLGNQPVGGGRALVGQQNIHPQGNQPGLRIPGSCQPNQQGNRRRWWWWF